MASKLPAFTCGKRMTMTGIDNRSNIAARPGARAGAAGGIGRSKKLAGWMLRTVLLGAIWRIGRNAA